MPPISLLGPAVGGRPPSMDDASAPCCVYKIELAEFQILRIANRRSRCITTVHADATDTRPAPRPLPTAVQGFSTTSNLPPKLISCTRTPTHTRTHAHSGETARAHSSSLSERVSGTRTSSPGIAHTHATPSHLPLAVAGFVYSVHSPQSLAKFVCRSYALYVEFVR